MEIPEGDARDSNISKKTEIPLKDQSRSGFMGKLDKLRSRLQKKEQEVSTNQLEELIGSAEWQSLRPNYGNPDALLPREISYDQINSIVNVFQDNYTSLAELQIKARTKDIDTEAFSPFFVSGLGSLRILGAGEEKLGFLLTTEEGKKMAVLLGLGSGLKPEIPSDPKLYPAFINYTGNLYYYSDFRTYLSLPINFGPEERAIRLQEYGGEPSGQVTNDLITKTEEKVTEYVKERGLIVVDPDFRKSSHYLSVNNDPTKTGVIDIKLRQSDGPNWLKK